MGDNTDTPTAAAEGEQDETVVEEKEYHMQGTTARITTEVEDDGGLSDDERKELAIALLEEGVNTDFADWDENHPVPTYGNRVV